MLTENNNDKLLFSRSTDFINDLYYIGYLHHQVFFSSFVVSL